VLARCLSLVARVDEEQKHLAILGVGGRVTHDPPRLVRCHKEHVWRRVVGHEPIPVIRREHRLRFQTAQIRPAGAHRGVEHGPDPLRIVRARASHADAHSSTK
jgi:hypothetical protein